MGLRCGSDVAQIRLGRGSDMAWMWLGGAIGCGRKSLADVTGKRFPVPCVPKSAVFGICVRDGHCKLADRLRGP